MSIHDWFNIVVTPLLIAGLAYTLFLLGVAAYMSSTGRPAPKKFVRKTEIAIIIAVIIYLPLTGPVSYLPVPMHPPQEQTPASPEQAVSATITYAAQQIADEAEPDIAEKVAATEILLPPGSCGSHPKATVNGYQTYLPDRNRYLICISKHQRLNVTTLITVAHETAHVIEAERNGIANSHNHRMDHYWLTRKTLNHAMTHLEIGVAQKFIINIHYLTYFPVAALSAQL